jgi:hypothetical protein
MIENGWTRKDVPLDTIVRGYDKFLRDWDGLFKAPMENFCQWIDDMVMARKLRKAHWDDAMRCTQHNLVDLVQFLDNQAYPDLRKVVDPYWCDCEKCHSTGFKKPLEWRGDSRHDDKGLRPWYVDDENRDRAYDEMITLWNPWRR